MSNSTPSRQKTEALKRAFSFVEANKDEKTITTFLNTHCTICFNNIDKLEKIAVLKNCGHHSCKSCFYDYLNLNVDQSCCFMCRSEFDENTIISTIDWGTCSIPEFKSNYEMTCNDYEMTCDDFDGSISRQITCCNPTRISRQITGGHHMFDYDIESPIIILPPIPRNVNNSFNKSQNGPTNEPFFYRTCLTQISDSRENIKYIGTVFLISPYEEMINKIPLDIIIILDISSSMIGFMIDNAIRSIEDLIKKLVNEDHIRLSLILFNDNAQHLFALQSITDQNFDSIISKVNAIDACGGTNYDVAFQMAKDVIPNDNEVQKIVFFLSDGAPQCTPNLDFIQKHIYDVHPTLILHIVSIGNNVEAEDNLLPLHCGREHELAKYTHLSESTDATFFNDHIGDAIGPYATQICFSFGSQIKPIYSKQIMNIDGSSTINLSVLSKNSTIQIAFMMDDKDDCSDIHVSYNIDGITSSKIAILDETNITEDTMKHFAVFRFYSLEMNMIIHDRQKDILVKKELLHNILSITTLELFGNFCDDFKSNLEIHIKNLDITTVEYRNLIAQSQVRQDSIGRQTSQTLSRGVSSHYTQIQVCSVIPEDIEISEEM